MNAQKCSGCPKVLKGIDFLLCCRCPGKYHYTCMNLSKVEFQGLSKDYIDKWVCPCCRCKEPKQGDNSNTPLRSAAPAPAIKLADNKSTTEPQHDNVTVRSKPRSSGNCGCLSAEIIREIIREELDRKFSNEIKDIVTKIDKFEERLAFSNSEHDKVYRESETHKTLIAKLQSENEELRATTRDLTHRLHQVEHLSRTNNLELQCVPEHSNENLYNTVQQLGNTIKCPVSESDLQYCSRIAKLNAASPRPRSILVKFSSRRLRDTFLAGVIKFNRNNSSDKLNSSHLGHGGKKSPVFVSEHLTPETKALHSAARRKAKELSYKFVWVRDGRVFMRKSENSNFIFIKDLVTLNNIS